MTHNTNYSDDWELANWKGFQKVLFRLQKKEYLKRQEVETRLMLESFRRSSFLLMQLKLWVTRQETQLNQGEKTAGTDDKKTLMLNPPTPH
jgi:N-terminal domain of reverse transcriptase